MSNENGKNGNGVITWRIMATAAWIALSTILFFWMQNIGEHMDKMSDRMDVISSDVSGIKGFLKAAKIDP